MKSAIKYVVIGSYMVAMPTLCMAQTIQVPPDKIFEIKIKVSDINTISKALGKMPFEDVAELMQSIRQQVFTQAQKPVDEKPIAGDNLK